MPRKKKIDYGTPEETRNLDERLLDFMASRISGSGRPEDAALLEGSYHAFFKEAWKFVNPSRPLVDSWYVGCVCEHFQAWIAGQIKKLVVAIPPSFGKSNLSCVMLPAWVWTHRPDEKMLFASYGDDLAIRDSLRCRDLILSPWYQERWRDAFSIKDDANTRDYYANDRGGHRIATTPGGTGTGLKANIILVDDAHKREEIYSESRRLFTINWWLKTMETRGEMYSETRRCVVGQRLKENDLSGTVLAARELGYESLILPMEYEVGRILYSLPLPDPLPRDAIVPTSLQRQKPELQDPRTEEGQLLCPEIVNEEGVLALKAALLDDAPGQLQQRPSAAAGTIFVKEAFRYFDVLSHQGTPCVRLGEEGDALARNIPLSVIRFFQTWDTAASIKETAAFTASITFGLTPTFDLLIWHVFRYRLPIMGLYPCLNALHTGPILVTQLQGRPSFTPAGAPWPSPLLYQAVEEKSTGIGLVQQAAADGRPLKVLKADGDKVLRARTVASLYEAGKVFHRRIAPWRGMFEDELLSFPGGTYMDMVDCLSYGGILTVHDKYTRLAAGRPAAYPDLEEKTLEQYEIQQLDADGCRFAYAVSSGDVVEVVFED